MTNTGRKAPTTTQDDRERLRKAPPCPYCRRSRYHAATCPESLDDTAITIRGRLYA